MALWISRKKAAERRMQLRPKPTPKSVERAMRVQAEEELDLEDHLAKDLQIVDEGKGKELKKVKAKPKPKVVKAKKTRPKVVKAEVEQEEGD